jgi:hypothetical protein
MSSVDRANTIPAPRSRTKRVIGSIALAALATLAIFHVLPLLPEPAQDECEFGPVSNARYRELLDEAKRRQRTTWAPIRWYQNEAGPGLNERFADLSQGMTSIYERMAAVHAVVRALGGTYRNTSHNRDRDPFEAVAKQGGALPINYALDLNKVGYFAPFLRTLWIGASVVGPKPSVSAASNLVKGPGDITLFVNFPTLVEGNPRLPRGAEVCPTLPRPELAPLFSLPVK